MDIDKSAFVECHQFKGVHGMRLEDAQKIPNWHQLGSDVQQAMLRPPAFTRAVSVNFSKGRIDRFDVQSTPQGGQYLALERERGIAERVRVWEGEWVCLLKDDTYIKLTDEQAKMFGVTESPYVPPSTV